MRYLLIPFFSILSIVAMYAQVTIGLEEAPEKGALLQLKDIQVDAENRTATKGGLLMPRVKLESSSSLMPFIANDPNFQSNVDKVKDKHIGLTVYNLTKDAYFKEGVYVWNGAYWTTTRETFFYMPSFNLPISTLGPDKYYPIYQEYEEQFTAAGLPVYPKDEIEFKVTHHDASVINDISFSDEHMIYTVLSTTAPAGAFLNIIIVVK